MQDIDIDKPIRSRKRSQSKEPEEKQKEIDEQKTPSRRKRAQSTASNKSITETETPEPKATSRLRPKTPSSEVRKIITRRASREMSERMDETKELDDSVLSTPKRRSTRVKSKKDDDNESVASEASMKSTRSKASDDTDKPVAVRKGRKSILATKTDLSVIPETIAEESEVKSSGDIIADYSSSRR